MALFVYSQNRLPPPFDYLNESIFEIPATQELRISNRHARLIFVLGGEARLRLTDNEPAPLRAGDVLVLPHSTHYGYRSALPGTGSRLQALAISIKSSPLQRRILSRFPQAVHLPGVQNAGMLHHLHHIRDEAEGGQKDASLAVGAHATLLVLELLRLNESPQPPTRTGRPGHYLVEQAREYIFKNHAAELSLSRIAWHLRLSEEYLARLFRRETGQTVFDCIREVRLNSAKRLLAGTNHSVGRIAGLAGFSSVTVFCRMFRRAFQLTPTDYREAHAGNPNPAATPAKSQPR